MNPERRNVAELMPGNWGSGTCRKTASVIGIALVGGLPERMAAIGDMGNTGIYHIRSEHSLGSGPARPVTTPEAPY